MARSAKQSDDVEVEGVDGAEPADEMLVDEIEFFGERQARWYQIAARNQVEAALVAGKKRILVVAPTGSGKTLTSGLIFTSDKIRAALGVKKGEKLRLLFIAHKHRLLSQAEQVYAAAEDVELILQSAFMPISDELVAAGWHITCLDEAHHEAMMSIQLQLEKIGDMPLIGLTATPDRADGCLIKFEEIIAPISREQAVKEGWLAPTKLFSFVDAPERDKSKILKDIIITYGSEMGQTMVFVRTKREVATINLFLQEQGYRSIAITSQSEVELDAILNRFSRKEIQFVVNCNKINEGVDVQFCESVILGRQFGSYPQLNQVIGRASRPDSDCRVWELINPLSGTNLDTTVVVGTPESHKLIYRIGGRWVEEMFDYVDGEDLEEFSGLKQERTAFRPPAGD